MDLIYADKNGIEIGFLKNCELDLAFGKDENNFMCTLDKDNHCCDYGYMIYAYGTEYGGIVDTITANTGKNTVSYSGRTWHGILERKVICPNSGENYFIVSGDANDVLKNLIERFELIELFEVENSASGIDIYYQFDRFIEGYTGIRRMLSAHSAKLKIEFRDKKVHLSAVPLIDYSQDDEFDGSLLKLGVTQAKRTVNHLICLGGENLSNRKVIHLFTDENGGIRPYTKTATPYSDKDYILDTSMRLLSGKDEVIEVYDYSNAPSVDNYLYLQNKPEDWEKNISNYFCLDSVGKIRELSSWEEDVFSMLEIKPLDWDANYKNYYYPVDGNFASVESISESVYTVLISQPSDWQDNYGSYYVINNGSYISVASAHDEIYTLQGTRPFNWELNYRNYYYWSGTYYSPVNSVTKRIPILLTSRPENWSTSYRDYYYWWSDGVSSDYKSVQGITRYRYDLQTNEPSDWKTNFKNYYYYKQYYRYYYKEWDPSKSDGKQVLIATVWYDKSMPTGKISNTLQREYVKKEKSFKEYAVLEKSKKWKKDTYYTKVSYEVEPLWAENKYYSMSENVVAPDWVANTFYTKSINTVPAWENGKFYSKSINTVPAWGYGKYYSKSVVTVYPQFFPMTYLEKRIDNFAELVRKGIERLKKLTNGDRLSISFSPDENYDIGDIVGVTEKVTGISVSQAITKKIVELKDNNETIKYEIGE